MSIIQTLVTIALAAVASAQFGPLVIISFIIYNLLMSAINSCCARRIVPKTYIMNQAVGPPVWRGLFESPRSRRRVWCQTQPRRKATFGSHMFGCESTTSLSPSTEAKPASTRPPTSALTLPSMYVCSGCAVL